MDNQKENEMETTIILGLQCYYIIGVHNTLMSPKMCVYVVQLPSEKTATITAYTSGN